VIRSFDGKSPQIAASAFVSEAAYVIGDVRIGEDSGVWPGAVVRGDFATITIGARTMIEDNCVLHTGVPMEIGGAVIHGKRIGNRILIGNNATILDGAVIGDNCVVGANCLVSQGMEVPEGSLVVGVPAIVKGKASPQQLEGLRSGIRSYVELVKRSRANRV